MALYSYLAPLSPADPALTVFRTTTPSPDRDEDDPEGSALSTALASIVSHPNRIFLRGFEVNLVDDALVGRSGHWDFVWTAGAETFNDTGVAITYLSPERVRETCETLGDRSAEAMLTYLTLVTNRERVTRCVELAVAVLALFHSAADHGFGVVNYVSP